MKHQWPPEVTRAMHQFFDAAPVAPSPTSVYEHRPIPPSRRPRTADVDAEQRLVPVEEIYVSVDSPPTSEARNRRLAMAAAAVAVVAVIGVAAIATNSPNSDDDVQPAPVAAPTVAPTTVAPTTVAPRTGTGFVDGEDGLSVSFTVPHGQNWEPSDRSVVGGNAIIFHVRGNRADAEVRFVDVGNVFADGCQRVLVDPPVGPTVDDLVSAFANLPGLAPTAAVDVTVDGYVGKQIEFTVPDYVKNECFEATFALWQVGDKYRYTYSANGNAHIRLWILDVGGTRLVIEAYLYASASQKYRAAIDEIVASIQIGQ